MRLTLVAIGIAVVLAGFVLWLKSMGALNDFWLNGVVLSKSYVDSESTDLWLKFMLGRGLGYVFFNAALWALASWAVWKALRRGEPVRKEAVDEDASFDVATALWCAVTLISVVMSGRFFGHYFIPALPALSLLGARGMGFLVEALRSPSRRRSAQIASIGLVLAFLIGFFRSHHRTAVLAYETIIGTRTRWSANWGMTKREQEADVVAQFVRERIPSGEPLFIWGYAHDVFWRTTWRPTISTGGFPTPKIRFQRPARGTDARRQPI
jgi:4-amino-4-deoxy-L-arabinose transferase-like glycosyltransferase